MSSPRFELGLTGPKPVVLSVAPRALKGGGGLDFYMLSTLKKHDIKEAPQDNNWQCKFIVDSVYDNKQCIYVSDFYKTNNSR